MSNEIETIESPSKRYAITLIWTGVLGWIAAFALTVERIHLAEFPNQALSCDMSPFISCGSVMKTVQSHLFGFPNPIIGLAAFFAPVLVGFAILAGARFAPWFWRCFVVAISMGFIFVLWLYAQSVFVIHVLCPYCMVAWTAMIPLFWRVILHAASEGIIDVPIKSIGFFVRWADSAWVFTLITELIAVVTIVIAFWSQWATLFH